MQKILILKEKKSLILEPKAPYNFDANFHKPSHFPSSDNIWKKGMYWITMVWKSEKLGLKFEDKETINKPKIKINLYSEKKLSDEFVEDLIPELRWRFNFDQDISNFNLNVKDIPEKWEGMKPMAANSLYETLSIYFVLQNASVRRSVQMLEKLFDKFGEKIKFDNKILSTFWEPEDMLKSTEQELRELKIGYRAKFFMKLSEQFVNGEINEFELRKLNKKEVKGKALGLYGIGPASVEYLLFEDFYFLDSIETIPPWEQKILSKLLFNKDLVPVQKILNFFKKFKGFEKLAFHYIWEDLFWKRKNEHIEWLEKEIRL